MLLASSLVVAAPVPKSLKKNLPDSERFQGAWEVVEESGGQAQMRSAPIIWTFTDHKMHSSDGNTNWTIKLDPEQSPKHIDITDYAGIYEFDGDKLKIAYSLDRNRPSDFFGGKGVYLVVLSRAKEQTGN